MSTIDYSLPGDMSNVYDMGIHTGTLNSVDYANDQASVNINGTDYSPVNIFYHCPNETSTTGGSAAFTVGDEVYVINPGGGALTAANLKIVGRVGGLLGCRLNLHSIGGTGELYRHDRISCSTLGAWQPYVHVVYGLTYAEQGGSSYMLWYDNTSLQIRMYNFDGSTFPWIPVAAWPPATPSYYVEGVAFDGANLIMAREKVGDATKSIIYICDGISATVSSSFEVNGGVTDITFDGINLIMSGVDYSGGPGVAKIWQFDGLSASVLNEFNFMSSNGALAIDWYKGNLLSWGNNSYRNLTLHNGFSDTISEQCYFYPSIVVTGIAYPELP